MLPSLVLKVDGVYDEIFNLLRMHAKGVDPTEVYPVQEAL